MIIPDERYEKLPERFELPFDFPTEEMMQRYTNIIASERGVSIKDLLQLTDDSSFVDTPEPSE